MQNLVELISEVLKLFLRPRVLEMHFTEVTQEKHQNKKKSHQER